MAPAAAGASTSQQDATAYAMELRMEGLFCTVCNSQNPFPEPARGSPADILLSIVTTCACCTSCNKPIPVPLVIEKEGDAHAQGTNARLDRRVLRRYAAVRPLGAGNFGRAYACVHVPQDAAGLPIASEKPVLLAAKRYTASADFSIFDGRERDILEALRSCRIYGVPVLWDVVLWHGAETLIMDYIPGESLESLITKRTPFGIDDVLLFLEQMSIILYQVHNDAKILHRDIKPSNIIVVDGANGIRQYFLIDFGIARYGAGQRTMAGTYAFSPEEQIDGYAVDSSDIFSLGLSAICMLWGCTGEGDSVLPPKQELRRILRELSEGKTPSSPAPPPTLVTRKGRKLCGILLQMIKHDCEERQRTAFDLWLQLSEKGLLPDGREGSVYWDSDSVEVGLSIQAVRARFDALRLVSNADGTENGHLLRPVFSHGSEAGSSEAGPATSPTDREELELELPGDPSTYDIDGLVHHVRCTLLTSSGLAAVEVLTSTLKLSRVNSGSTKIVLDLASDKKEVRKKILEVLQSELGNLGVKKLKVIRQSGSEDCKLATVARGDGKRFKWGNGSMVPKAASKSVKETHKWTTLLDLDRPPRARDQPPALRHPAVYVCLPSTAATGAEFEDDRARLNVLAKKIEAVVPGGRGSDSQVLIYALSDLMSDGGYLPTAENSVPAAAATIVQALGCWREGSVVDTLSSISAEVIERTAARIGRVQMNLGETYHSVWRCAVQLLTVSTSAERRWRRCVRWFRPAPPAACSGFVEVQLHESQQLQAANTNAICTVCEVSSVDPLQLVPPSVSGSLIYSRVSVWIVGPFPGVDILVRLSSFEDVDTIESSLREAEQDANGDDALKDDARPLEIFAKFGSPLDFRFRLMSDTAVENWKELIAREADNISLKVDVQKIVGTSSAGLSVVLLDISTAEAPVLIRKFVVGELRAEKANETLPGTITLDITGSIEQHAPAPASTVIMATPVPSNPVFAVYPAQRIVAGALLGRACRILVDSEEPASLRTKFNQLHFLILTPRFNTLRNQTRNRIVQAGLLDAGTAESQVFTYLDSRSNMDAFDEFKRRARRNPKTLCVLIADECHWGIVRDSAHDKLVNDSQDDESSFVNWKNVLVLLVSATPANVLTTRSRIPERYKLLKDTPTYTEIKSATPGSFLKKGAVIRILEHAEYKDLQWAHFEVEGESSRGYIKLRDLKGSPELHVVRWDEAVKAARGADQQQASGDAIRYHRVTEFVESVDVKDEDWMKSDLQDDPFFVELVKHFRRLRGRYCSSKKEKLAYKDVLVLAADYAFSLIFQKFFIQDKNKPSFDAAVAVVAFQKAWETLFGECDAIADSGNNAIKLSFVGEAYWNYINKAGRDPEIICASQEDGGSDGGSQGTSVPMYLLAKFQELEKPESQRNRFLYTQTDRVIEDLLKPDASGAGRMKLVRANDNPSGTHFVNIVSTARRICELSSSFAVVADFGDTLLETEVTQPFKKRYGIRSQANADDHLTYEDLQGLPCLLVLCEKGRMGDTFPQSFNMMDLRSRHIDNVGALTSFIQEIGRLCRYARGSAPGRDRPYAIIGKKLHATIRNAIEERKKNRLKHPDAPENVIDYLKLGSLDQYIKRFARKYGRAVNPRSDCEPTNNSYDLQPHDQHMQRLLLEAEPQIGKTGTYIYFLLQLREILTEQPIEPPIAPPAPPKRSSDVTSTPASYSMPPDDWSQEAVLRDRLQALSSAAKVADYVKSISEGECGDSDFVPSEGAKLLQKLKKESSGIAEKAPRELKTKETVPLLSWDGRLSIEDSANRDETLFDPARTGKKLESLLKRRLQLQSGHGSYEELEQLLIMTDSTKVFRTAVQVQLDAGNLAPPVEKQPGKRYELNKLLLKEIGVPDNCYGHIQLSIPGSATAPAISVDREGKVTGIQPDVEKAKAAGRGQPQRLAFVTGSRGPMDAYLQALDGDFPAGRIVVVRAGSEFDAFVSIWGHVITIISLPEELQVNGKTYKASSGGTGYARLFVQLLAFYCKLEWVWLLDDNVLACKGKRVTEAMREVEDAEELRPANESVAVAGFNRLRPSGGAPAGAGGSRRTVTSPYFYGAFLLNVDITLNAKCLYPPKRFWSEIDFHLLCTEKKIKIFYFEHISILLAGSVAVRAPRRNRTTAVTAATAATAMHAWPASGKYELVAASSPTGQSLSTFVPWLASRVKDGLTLGFPVVIKSKATEFTLKVDEALENSNLTLRGCYVDWKSFGMTEKEIEEEIETESMGKDCSALVFVSSERQFRLHNGAIPGGMIQNVKSSAILVAVPSTAWVGATNQAEIERICNDPSFEAVRAGFKLERIWSSCRPLRTDSERAQIPCPKSANPDDNVWIVLDFKRFASAQSQQPQPQPQPPANPERLKVEKPGPEPGFERFGHFYGPKIQKEHKSMTAAKLNEKIKALWNDLGEYSRAMTWGVQAAKAAKQFFFDAKRQENPSVELAELERQWGRIQDNPDEIKKYKDMEVADLRRYREDLDKAPTVYLEWKNKMAAYKEWKTSNGARASTKNKLAPKVETNLKKPEETPSFEFPEPRPPTPVSPPGPEPGFEEFTKAILLQKLELLGLPDEERASRIKKLWERSLRRYDHGARGPKMAKQFYYDSMRKDNPSIPNDVLEERWNAMAEDPAQIKIYIDMEAQDSKRYWSELESARVAYALWKEKKAAYKKYLSKLDQYKADMKKWKTWDQYKADMKKWKSEEKRSEEGGEKKRKVAWGEEEEKAGGTTPKTKRPPPKDEDSKSAKKSKAK